MLKECVVCGAQFDARGTAITCGSKCRLERDRLTRKAYREAHPEMVRGINRKWYYSNPDKAKASRRKWEEENPDRAKEYRRAWVDQNQERCDQYRQKWVRNNPEKHQECRTRNSRTYYDRMVAAYRLVREIEKKGIEALL